MNLVHFKFCIEEKKLFLNVLDPFVAQDLHREDNIIVLRIASACVQPNPETRPSLRHVADALERLNNQSQKCSQGLQKFCSQNIGGETAFPMSCGICIILITSCKVALVLSANMASHWIIYHKQRRILTKLDEVIKATKLCCILAKTSGILF